jgi:hypothetical protein
MKNGEKPSRDIKIWGSIVYYKIKGPGSSNKLDPLINKGVLIGYGADSHQYEVWDFKSRKAL